MQCMSIQVLHVHSTVVGSQKRNMGVLFIQTNGNHGNRLGSGYTKFQKIIVNGMPSPVPTFLLVLVPQEPVLTKLYLILAQALWFIREESKNRI